VQVLGQTCAARDVDPRHLPGDALPPPSLDDLEASLVRSLAGVARQLGRRPESLRSLLSVSRARALLTGMEQRIGSLAGRKVLEVGSGSGLALALANTEFGADAWGIDPGQAGYGGIVDIGLQVLHRHGVSPQRLVCALGETLPFPAGHFDVVYSYYVLEHVQDVARVLREAARVTRPGGCVYLVVPNYGSVWEGHYGIPWIPHLPKSLAGVYVRLLGRSAAPLQEIHLLTVTSIADSLRGVEGLGIESLGMAEFEARLLDGAASDLDTARWAASLFKIVRGSALLRPLLALVRLFQLWTPLVIVARREPDDAGVTAARHWR
jgi:ubiquinone/menaquinone biosynthesis C-methylase UbiE